MRRNILLAAALDDFDARSLESAVKNFGPSLAVQSQKDEADINVLVARFGLGVDAAWPQQVKIPLDGDFSDIGTFQEAQNALIEARNSFARLPAAIRARFDNDPGAFVDFCLDKENLDEMRELGLAVPVAAVGVSGSSDSVVADPSGPTPGRA